MGEVSPMLLVTLRWLGVVFLLLVFARNAALKNWNELKPHVPLLFLMGSLGFTAFNVLFYIAAYTTTALNIGIIQGSIPVFVLIGGLLIYRYSIGGLQILGVIVTIFGVCIVASAGDLLRIKTLSINQGDYFMIVACFLYSGYALALRKFSGMTPLSLFSVVAMAALVSSIPVAMVEYSLGQLMWPSAKGWVIVGLVTLLPSFIAQICFIQGVSDLGPGRAGVFVNLVPVFAAILAVVILRESFHWYHGVALLLVVSGIALAERNKRKQ